MSDPAPLDPEASKAADAARVAAAGERWRARSRRVKLFRRVLPIAILLVAGGAVGWVTWRSVMSSVERRQQTLDQEIRLSNPMFHGQDEQGRAFIIGAGEAVRDPETGFFRLEAPVMRLMLETGKSTEMSAGHGIYNEADRTLILRDRVRIADGGAGFQFVTPEARVDTRTGTVTGDRGITGSGALGNIDAASYAIYEQGGRIVFRGSGDNKVRAVLNTDADR